MTQAGDGFNNSFGTDWVTAKEMVWRDAEMRWANTLALDRSLSAELVTEFQARSRSASLRGGVVSCWFLSKVVERW